MKKLSKKQTLSYLALQKVARLQELLKMTQNAEVVSKRLRVYTIVVFSFIRTFAPSF